MSEDPAAKLTKKDFESDQDVRWCPGCGDYAILSAIQKALPEIGIAREDCVFISGIGCSSRFPYYMNTYGFHTIHGRAPGIATGLKVTNPDLQVWMITGDGDGLSIGGNHLLHLLRRNVDINVLLFNNEIYGLTKGQYSPTSSVGTVAKSTPFGSQDHPVNPLAFALGAGCTWYARTVDRDLKHMSETFKDAPQHNGTSFIEIMQNCIVFNDGVHQALYDPKSKLDNTLFLEDGQPMTFGKDREHALIIEGSVMKRVATADVDAGQIAVHNASSKAQAFMLSELELPVPVGLIYSEDRVAYNDDVHQLEERVIADKGPGDLNALMRAGMTWEVN